MAIVIEATEFDINKISYSIQPKSFEIKDSDGNKQKMTYISIVLKYDGNQEFLVKTPKMFSFGLKRSTFGGKPKYSTSFVMKDKDGATPEQQTFYTKVEQLVKKTTEWMIKHKIELKAPTLAENMLEGLSPVYIKKDDEGRVVEGSTPSLNCSLKQKGDNILTKFYEDNDSEDDIQVDANTLISTATEKRFYTMTEGVVTFPDVYFAKGKAPKLHCVLDEATVEAKKERTQRLTGKSKKLFTPTILETSTPTESDDEQSSKPAATKVVTSKAAAESDDDDDEDDDDEETQPTPKASVTKAPKAVPRRTK